MGAFRLVSVIAASGMLAGLAGVASLSGCTSYTNVPGPESALAGQDPNSRQASRAAEAALVWTVRRHPVDGPFVINLPPGTSTETAQAIAAAVGPMAQIPDAATTDLPVYHVSRVWIRLSDAKVDVVFPTRDGLGREIQRGVTAWMNVGLRSWTVSRGQYWSPGTVPIPSIWVPIPQADLDAIAAAEKAAERAARQPQPVAEPVAEPAAQPTAQPIEQSEPMIPLEPATPTAQPTQPAPEAPAPGGATYREVPVGGGN
jgi:hypothetical protein